jgi:hypothetical protein
VTKSVTPTDPYMGVNLKVLVSNKTTLQTNA